MPRAALSASEIDAFRQRVIEVATGLFAESGFEAVTLRAIAAEVGCSPMTPYRYFEDKDEIFTLVVADAFRRFADAQESAISGLEDPMTKLSELGTAYVRFALQEPDSYRVIFELRQSARDEHPEYQLQGERAWRFMSETIAEGVEAGYLDGDSNMVAHIMWSAVHGVVSLHLSNKLTKDVAIEELVPQTMRALLIGIAGPKWTEETDLWLQ